MCRRCTCRSSPSSARCSTPSSWYVSYLTLSLTLPASLYFLFNNRLEPLITTSSHLPSRPVLIFSHATPTSNTPPRLPAATLCSVLLRCVTTNDTRNRCFNTNLTIRRFNKLNPRTGPRRRTEEDRRATNPLLPNTVRPRELCILTRWDPGKRNPRRRLGASARATASASSLIYKLLLTVV